MSNGASSRQTALFPETRIYLSVLALMIAALLALTSCVPIRRKMTSSLTIHPVSPPVQYSSLQNGILDCRNFTTGTVVRVGDILGVIGAANTDVGLVRDWKIRVEGIIDRREFKNLVEVDFTSLARIPSFHPMVGRLTVALEDRPLSGREAGDRQVVRHLEEILAEMRNWESRHLVLVRSEGRVVWNEAVAVPGQYVREGEPLATVHTLNPAIVGKFELPEAMGMHIGRNFECRLSLPGYPAGEYGYLTVYTTDRTPFPTTDKYAFTVAIPEETISNRGRAIDLVPGMKGSVDIELGEETLLERFLRRRSRGQGESRN